MSVIPGRLQQSQIISCAEKVIDCLCYGPDKNRFEETTEKGAEEFASLSIKGILFV